MAVARIFQSGNSQAVRLPKEFRFDSDEVEIFRRGEEVVLLEKLRGMERLLELLSGMPDDVWMDEPDDPPPQEREGL